MEDASMYNGKKFTPSNRISGLFEHLEHIVMRINCFIVAVSAKQCCMPSFVAK